MSKQNNSYKSIILKIYTKLLSVENEELENSNEINNLSMQLIKENDYLRNSCASIIGDAIQKELSNTENNTKDNNNNIPIKKKKRNHTQINFDFLNEENREIASEKDKNSENTTENQV